MSLKKDMDKDESDKNDSQDFIKDFPIQYKSFDKKRVLEKLNEGYQISKTFHLQVPIEIRYIARKHGLPEDKWDQIYPDLIAEDVDNHTKLLLTQALKYSIKKDNVSIKLGDIFIILQKNHDVRIQSEIILALGYQIKNSAEKNSEEPIDEKFVRKISITIGGLENESNATSISFLNDQIHRLDHIDNGSAREISHEKKRIATNYSKKRPQLIVTKNQHTSKINYKNNQSEELANRLNTVNIFKNFNKKIKVNSNIHNHPTIPDKDGSDRSCFQGTYTEVVYLYNKIKAKDSLKRKDKDEL